MKNVLRGILVFCTFIFVACTGESNTESVNDTEQNLTHNLQDSKASFSFLTGSTAIVEIISEDPEFSLPLDQETLDQLLEAAGYSETMHAEDVNKIIDELMIGREIGLKDYMDTRSDLKKGSKDLIMQMVTSGYIKDLESREDFRELPEMDQNILMSGNQLVHDVGVKKGNSRQLSPVEIGMIGLVGGGGIGWWICGPPCAIVGGFIGGIGGLVFGILTGNK